MKYLPYFVDIANSLQDTLSYRLLTISYLDHANDYGVRMYSSDERHYPVGAVHNVKEHNLWTETILQKQTYLASHPHDFDTEHFSNLEELIAQGYGSVVNFPVVLTDQLVGTINLLDRAGHYRDLALIEKAFADIDENVQHAFALVCEHLRR